jgi:hypothetical protein
LRSNDHAPVLDLCRPTSGVARSPSQVSVKRNRALFTCGIKYFKADVVADASFVGSSD